MIIVKNNKIRVGMLVRNIADGLYYNTRWEFKTQSILAYNNVKTLMNVTTSNFDIIGEIGKNWIVNKDGDFEFVEPTKYEKNDIYEVRNQAGEVKDLLLITKIESQKTPYTLEPMKIYHVLHKDGSVEKLDDLSFCLYNFKPKDKKLYGVHYTLRR